MNLNKYVDFQHMSLDTIKDMFESIPDDKEFTKVLDTLTFVQKLDVMRYHLKYDANELLSNYKEANMLNSIVMEVERRKKLSESRGEE